MADDDYSLGGRNHASAPHVPGKHRGPRFSWNPAYEATFFQSLCESVELGLREGSTFKQEAWDRAGQALIDRHNAFANKGHLINKSDNARKKFRLWRGLREDPSFQYDSSTRMVTGSEEAWRRHIEREPLSKSLRGRPFEHETFYNVLFPDVIGSGGAPKRVTKPRRKGADGTEIEIDTPGTSMLNLMGDTSYVTPAPIPSNPVPPQSRGSTTTSATTFVPPAPAQQAPARPTSTSIPPRTSITSTSALTPPEETAPNSRKRFLPADSTANTGATSTASSGPTEKRRRTTVVADTANSSQSSAAAPAPPPAPTATPAAATVAAVAPPPAASAAAQTTTDGVQMLVEFLRAKTGPRWSEQAVDLFFREFGQEDMDLQLKIAEKALTDENKAMVFCKMPQHLRKHWVKRLREAANRIA